MDQADRDIIQVLQIDGRMPYGQIGCRVGLTEATVRRRVGRLIREGSIIVVPVLNLSKVGYQVTALIGLQTVPGRSEDVAEVVSQMKEVQVVAVTTGHYDVFIWAGFQSTQDLHSFVNDKLAVVDGVVRSESFINLSIKKTPYG
jgi:Lrp/AsnC family transcriptional regulator for asnA, asnC and gidA